MKQCKRLLALLLTLSLAFTLALPAFAEDPDPAMPVITVQPQSGQISLGGTYKHSVEASIPNGDEVGYRWYRNGEVIAHTSSEWLSTNNRTTAEYYVVVYNVAQPELSVTSETARVEVHLTLGERLGGILADSWGWLIFLSYAGPVVFIIAPVYMLFTSPVVAIKLLVELFCWIFE